MFSAAMSGPFDRRDLRGETVALEIDGQPVEAFMPWPGESFAIAADCVILFACSPRCQHALADLATGTSGLRAEQSPAARKREELLSALSDAQRGRQTLH